MPADLGGHGSTLDAEDEVLLRGLPPSQALAWVARAAGPSVAIRRVQPLAGGTSSAVHEFLVEDAGRLVRLVLRRYVRPGWLIDQPDLAEREAEVLSLLETTPVPAPRLVAVDPSGVAAGAPAVLMTAVPGREDWPGSQDEARLGTMAELLGTVHATPLPNGCQVRSYRPAYRSAELAPPAGTNRPDVWKRAFDIYVRPPRASTPILIHRDFHPGNILWSGGAITGLVDWATASQGEPAADVGHCRANLTEFGETVPDRFLRLCRAVGVCDDYEPYWDVAAAVDLGHSAEEPDSLLETWLARAISECG